MATPQSITVDYRVIETFDGATPAPQVTLGQTLIDQQSQVYRPPTSRRLGVIDPDLGLGGSIGPRCISQLVVDFGGVTPPGSRIFVAALNPQGFIVQELEVIADVSGSTNFIQVMRPIVVPQGAAVIIDTPGFVATSEALVRLSVDAPEDTCELLALLSTGAVDVLSNGTLVVPRVRQIDFTGAGVTVAPAPGSTAQVDIPGGAGAGIDVLDAGTPVASGVTGLNFEGCLVTPGPGPAQATIEPLVVLPWTPATATAAGTTTLVLRETQRYDASALAPNALVLEFPAAPADNDNLQIKEVGNSFVPVTLDGNGANVEGPLTPSAPTVSVGLPRVNLEYQYDAGSNIWRIV